MTSHLLDGSRLAEGPSERHGDLPEPIDRAAPVNPASMLLEARRAAEDTIRAFDNKAQIAGIGMILSVNAIVGLGNSWAPSDMGLPPTLVLAMSIWFIVCLCLFAWVLWPIPPRLLPEGQTGGRVQGTFYVDLRRFPDLASYVLAIDRTNWTVELAYEVTKLVSLRDSKQRRFARGLRCAALLYVMLLSLGALHMTGLLQRS